MSLIVAGCQCSSSKKTEGPLTTSRSKGGGGSVCVVVVCVCVCVGVGESVLYRLEEKKV